jgi:hypothetical protein
MYAIVISPCTKPIRVIHVKWVLNFNKKNIEKNKSNVCYYNKNLGKKSKFDKTLFKKDFQIEEEGLYNIYSK